MEKLSRNIRTVWRWSGLSENVKGEERSVRERREHTEMPLFLDTAIVKELAGATWHGKANRLSGEHGVHWDVIDEVADASWKTQANSMTVSVTLPVANASHRLNASRFTNDERRRPVGWPDHSPAPKRRLV